MNTPIPVSQLQPGDHLLYNVKWDLCDCIIRVKTWSDVAHIEVFDGDGGTPGGSPVSLAARRDGVNRYPFRPDGLAYVLRPEKWDTAAGRYWFEKVARGQAYDWKGLLCFALAVRQGSPDKMFCSEFARNLDREALFRSFADPWPGDKVAPGDFLKSPSFFWIWAL